MAAGLTFVDTNVLVYAVDTAETRRVAARERLDALWASRSGVLSTQVLQEFYVVSTRKLAKPLSRRSGREIVDAFRAWPTVTVDINVILAASQLEERHRLSFWDALIIEAARVAGATTLLTEDLQHGSRVAGVRIEDPFRNT